MTTEGPLYPAVAIEHEGDITWGVCANGHRFTGSNCRTCETYHKFRAAGRPDCEEPGCSTVVCCSERAWAAGVRKCELHWTIDRANEWNVGPMGIDEWTPGLAQYSNQRWNGWAMPRFDAYVIAKIIEWVTRDASDHYDFEWDGEVLVYTQFDGEDRYVERLEPDEDGLYDLGAGSWVWSEAEHVCGVLVNELPCLLDAEHDGDHNTEGSHS